MAAPFPSDEFERLLALARYEILDTLPEEAFDRVTRLAADLLGTDLAVINFVDLDRQWGKSCVGVDNTEAPRSESFCAWTILSDEVLVIPDAVADERFRNYEMVTGEPHIRLYAGAPLVTPTGHRVGTLCVTQSEPREFGDRERRVLKDFAGIVVDELELRLRTLELEREVSARERVTEDLRQSVQHAQILTAIHELLGYDLSPEEACRAAVQQVASATAVDWAGLLTVEDAGATDVQTVWSSGALDAGDARMSRLMTGLVRTGESGFVDATFGDAHVRAALGETAASAAVTLPLGRVGSTSYALCALRVEGRPWRGSDRALLSAASRSVQAALGRLASLRSAETDARRDALTGLANRRAFDETLEALDRSGGPFTLALLDLDGFKAVNDTLGHSRGDALLRLFAEALRAEAADGDEVFRLGGDEFVLLRPEAGAHDALQELVDVAVAVVRQSNFPRVGASVGTGSRVGAEVRAHDALQEADARMYAAKQRRVVRPPSGPEGKIGGAQPPLRALGLQVDPSAHTVRCEDRRAQLSPTESRLLVSLVSFPGRVFSREELMVCVTGSRRGEGSNVLDVHISNLRRKLAVLSPSVSIRSVRGSGYTLTAVGLRAS
ncbi:diguanylate cyclase domain-containing protein [Deinococcus pimensis]|uniref:diguanylate cyclase domain-containing protein n=1 Tax=Deinococcus pimensis TaxID=309888 RepID=UPI0004B3B94B|nr:diguanylate cyclase [Deinococcus pimensis]